MAFDHRNPMSPIMARPRNSISNPPNQPRSSDSAPRPNLDFLAFSKNSPNSTKTASVIHKSPTEMLRARHSIVFPTNHAAKDAEGASTADWERLIGSLDQSDANIYDTIYGGGQTPGALSSIDLHTTQLSMPLSTSAIEAQNLAWDMRANLNITHRPSTTSTTVTATGTAPTGHWSTPGANSSTTDSYSMLTSPAPVPRSIMSLSDDSLSGGEDFVSVSTGGGSHSALGTSGASIHTESDSVEIFRGLVIPASVSPALYASEIGVEDDMGGLDMGFGL
jgi:hypothetical protein